MVSCQRVHLKTRVLVVAADSYELRHIRPRPDWKLIASGPGGCLAAAAIEGELAEVVVSTGVCGGLDPSLSAGDIFVATSVNGRKTRLPATGASFRSGPLISIDRVADTAEEKGLLFRAGAMAVDMESAAVADFATSAGAVFYCVRAVSDVAGESFAVDLNAARTSDGRFSKAHIVCQALRRPVAIVPELVRLRRNAESAARALGAFLANCDF